MDKAALVQKRRRKYLAQLLEAFEELIEPNLSASVDPREFKGLVRAKMNALAVDAVDLMNLKDGVEVNGYAIETTDRLFPHGRPHSGARS